MSLSSITGIGGPRAPGRASSRPACAPETGAAGRTASDAVSLSPRAQSVAPPAAVEIPSFAEASALTEQTARAIARSPADAVRAQANQTPSGTARLLR